MAKQTFTKEQLAELEKALRRHTETPSPGQFWSAGWYLCELRANQIRYENIRRLSSIIIKPASGVAQASVEFSAPDRELSRLCLTLDHAAQYVAGLMGHGVPSDAAQPAAPEQAIDPTPPQTAKPQPLAALDAALQRLQELEDFRSEVLAGQSHLLTIRPSRGQRVEPLGTMFVLGDRQKVLVLDAHNTSMLVDEAQKIRQLLNHSFPNQKIVILANPGEVSLAETDLSPWRSGTVLQHRRRAAEPSPVLEQAREAISTLRSWGL